MAKTIQKILIDVNEIDVFSNTNGVNSVTQLNLEPDDGEIEAIFEKHNLSNLIYYSFDMKIIRALAENEAQLKDYLDASRRAKFSDGKIKVPETIPEIEYDLKDLKNSDFNIQKKLEIYRQAKETKNLFKNAKGRVKVQIGMLDKAYLEIQALLINRENNKTLALNAGPLPTQRRNIREEVKFTGETNVVPKTFNDNINPVKEISGKEVGEE